MVRGRTMIVMRVLYIHIARSDLLASVSASPTYKRSLQRLHELS